MLRISDFNTTGATGSDVEKDSNWFNLVKSNGVSNKSDDAGGAFGIGKSVQFLCSDLSTVFYSTYDVDGKEAHQGVSRLVTFEDKDGDKTSGEGYYGVEKNLPISRQLSLDKSFTRGNITGTDIFIAGFSPNPKKIMEEAIAATVENFLVAIFRGDLEVDMFGEVVSKSTLQDIFVRYENAIKKKSNAWDKYDILTSQGTSDVLEFKEANFCGLGEIALLLKKQEGFSRTISRVRKNCMQIFCKKETWIPFDFAGIFFVNGDGINKALKDMENPQHDKWESSNTTEKEILKQIKNFISESLNAIIETNNPELDVNGMGEYLPDELSEGEEGKANNELSTEIEDLVVTTVERKPVSGNLESEGDDSSQDGTGDVGGEEGDEEYTHNGGHGKKTGEREPDKSTTTGSGSSSTKESINILPERIKCICVNPAKGLYRLIFTPQIDAVNGIIKVNIVAESGTYEADLVSATDAAGTSYVIDKNSIIGFEFFAGVQVVIDTEIKCSEYSSLEVKIYANTK